MERLKKMTDSMAHRGPDGEGQWLNPEGSVGLGHRRLSILDLSEHGSQPMHYAGRYSITLNGEIYNYLELRAELEQAGYRFHSGSDTEVLLAAYAAWGTGCLSRLDGMFAFAIFDAQEKTLFCARDRFGEKPFYYAWNPGRELIFGSEIKSLLAAGVPRHLNEKLLFYYLAYEIVSDPFDKQKTFYNGILKLDAASYLLVKSDGTLVQKRYWDIRLSAPDTRISMEDACEKLRELFTVSTIRRLRSDVPVGSSFSGGMDSTITVMCIRELRKNTDYRQHVFSARFSDPQWDEGAYMEEIDRYPEIVRHDVWVDEKVLTEELYTVLHHHDEPMGSASPLAQYKVMQLAKEQGITVLLDGQGADEPMAGYMHFFHPFFREMYLTNRPLFNQELAAYKSLRGSDFPINWQFKLNARFPGLLKGLGNIRRQFSSPAYLNLLNKDFARRNRQTVPPFPIFNNLNESLRFNTLETGLENLLRLADRNSMAHSREVRLPYLNHELVEFLFTLPAGFKIHEAWTKFILRKSFDEMIPAKINWRVKKIGYRPPQENWLQQPRARAMYEDSVRKLTREGYLAEGAIIPGNKAWFILNAAWMLGN